MKYVAKFLMLLSAACAVSAFAACWVGDAGKALGFMFGATFALIFAGLSDLHAR